MNAETFNRIIQEQLNRCKEVLFSKNASYAPNEDKLHNFRVGAAIQQCSVAESCGGFLAKHLASIYTMIRSGETYDLDIWDEKITDAINYLLFLRAIIGEREETKTVCNEIYIPTPSPSCRRCVHNHAGPGDPRKCESTDCMDFSQFSEKE